MSKFENIPLYFRLYHRLKQDIISGEIEKGAKFPSISELVSEYGASDRSVRSAIDLLEAEGLVVRKQGWGTMVPENADLTPIEMGTLIHLRNVGAVLKNSEIVMISAEWVKPGCRLMKLYDLEEGPQQPLVYKIFYKITLPNFSGLKALLNQYVSEKMVSALNLDKDSHPLDILSKLAEWLDTPPLKLKESLRPFLCTDKNAELLDLPSGTPVFFQDVIVRDTKGRVHFWEMISTANIHFHEMEFK